MLWSAVNHVSELENDKAKNNHEWRAILFFTTLMAN